MSRPQLALVAGGVLLIGTCLVGCCLPAFLEPQPPWSDPVAQQAAWGRTEDLLFSVAIVLLLGALLLLAFAFVAWRAPRWKAKQATQQDE
jgi:hypothetical protein